MNRTDRLLAIVLELQARKRVRAEDLAETFETSKRTIYRDIQALCETGVPIVSIPGRGYSLMEGYFLPPLSFNTEEAITLLLGTDLVAQNFDEQYREAAVSATRKIAAVLPDRLRSDVEDLERSIRFIAVKGHAAPETLQRLRYAVIQRKTVRFAYHARYRDGKPSSTSQREADPYSLIHIGGAWMLAAYCHTRHDIRNFRLDRMEDVVITDSVFVRPAEFKIGPRNEDDRKVLVRVIVDHETARWVRESPSFYQVAQEECPDGLLVTLAVRQPGDVLNWLLGWGSHIRVLEPEPLRELLLREAERVVAQYSITSVTSHNPR